VQKRFLGLAEDIEWTASSRRLLLTAAGGDPRH